MGGFPPFPHHIRLCSSHEQQDGKVPRPEKEKIETKTTKLGKANNHRKSKEQQKWAVYRCESRAEPLATSYCFGRLSVADWGGPRGGPGGVRGGQGGINHSSLYWFGNSKRIQLITWLCLLLTHSPPLLPPPPPNLSCDLSLLPFWQSFFSLRKCRLFESGNYISYVIFAIFLQCMYLYGIH